MAQFIPFFLILFVAVFFSEIFKRLHLPWVIALILGGILIGPFGLGFFEINPTIEFLGEIGLIFLMFTAGLETKFSTFKESKREITTISLLNGIIPFIAGFLIAHFLGFSLETSLLFGIIFISSSAAVVVPVFESVGILDKKFGKTVIASVIVQDVFSLVLLSIFLQTVNPISSLPIPLFLAALVSIFLLFRFLIPKVKWVFGLGTSQVGDVFQQELRVVFTILIGIVIAFELLGVHAIVAGFIAGLLLSDVVNTQALQDKIRVISYGLFIPIFFVVLGSKTDISVFSHAGDALVLTISVILGSILSKFLSGWLSGKLLGYENRESSLIGFSTMPALSVHLAVAFTGVELGLLSKELATTFVLLSLVTVFVSPFLIKLFSKAVVQNKVSRKDAEV